MKENQSKHKWFQVAEQAFHIALHIYELYHKI